MLAVFFQDPRTINLLYFTAGVLWILFLRRISEDQHDAARAALWEKNARTERALNAKLQQELMKMSLEMGDKREN